MSPLSNRQFQRKMKEHHRRMNTFGKIFNVLFFVMFVVIVFAFLAFSYFAYETVDIINEHGLKHLIESIWEGKNHASN